MKTFANVPRRCNVSQRQSLLCLILMVGLLQIINTYTDITSILAKARDRKRLDNQAGQEKYRLDIQTGQENHRLDNQTGQEKHRPFVRPKDDNKIINNFSDITSSLAKAIHRTRLYDQAGQEENRRVVRSKDDSETYAEKAVRSYSAKHVSNSSGERLEETGPDLRNVSKHASRENCSGCDTDYKLGTNGLMQKLNSTWNFTCNGCFKNVFDYIIPGKHICEGESPIVLIFLITSAHAHAKRREVLRKTWLTLVNKTTYMRYAFLLGRTPDINLHNLLKVENDEHADIIMEDFLDTYLNLTYKTLMGLKWVGKNCPRARYVMKTDDDMFIDVPQLRILLQTGHILNMLVNSVIGRCNSHAEPVRVSKSKYYASYVSYPYETYPPICLGTGYVMSMHNAKKIYAISKNVPFYYLEDVYVGMCLQSIGVSTFNYQGFSLNMREAWMACRSTKQHGIISVHALNDINVARLWIPDFCSNLKKTGRWLNARDHVQHNNGGPVANLKKPFGKYFDP